MLNTGSMESYPAIVTLIGIYTPAEYRILVGLIGITLAYYSATLGYVLGYIERRCK